MTLFNYRSNKFTKKSKLIKKNLESDLDIIKQEVNRVRREREIESLKKELNDLETEYNFFKSLKNYSYVIFKINYNKEVKRGNYNELGYYIDKYSLCIFKDDKNFKYLKHISIYEQIFTNEEYKGLYEVFYNFSKLAKENRLYDIIMNRIDNYYLNKINVIKSKI